MIHKYLLPFLCLCVPYLSKSQNNRKELSSPLSGNQQIQARERITLKAGFHYKASAGQSLNARITYTAPKALSPAQRLSAEPQALNPSLAVGSLPGSWSVSPMGAAQYTIPLAVPEGINGLTPQLSIVYNSMSGDGILGKGFSLAGLSAISRIGSNYYNDGMVDPVDFDDNDHFALDGQRLIPIGNQQYRTEVESFALISQEGNLFSVSTKEGKTLSYAHNYQNGLSYHLSKVNDPTGNEMYYTYTGIEYPYPYLSSIQYGSNSWLGLSAQYSVTFVYEGRNSPITQYIGGRLSQISKRLSQILIGSQAQTLYSYTFSYDSQDRLQSITKKDGQGNTLNPTQIQWQQMGTEDFKTKEIPRSALAPRADDNPAHYLGDYDGDGDIDFVQQAPDKSLQLYLNQPNHPYFSLGNTTTIPDLLVGGIYPGDFNGDGKTDLVTLRYITSLSYYSVYPVILLSNGNSFTQIQAAPFYLRNTVLLIGDYNGDSKDELCVKELGKCTFYGLNSNHQWSSLFSRQQTEASISESNGFVYTESYPVTYYDIPFPDTGDQSNCPDFKESVIDINGDGKAEILSVNKNQFTIYELNQGSIQPIATQARYPDYQYTLLGDYNGDGKTDIATYNSKGDFKLFISTGISFVEQPFHNFIGYRTDRDYEDWYGNNEYKISNIALNQYYNADLDGDGKTDIICIGVGTYDWDKAPNIYIAYNQGNNNWLIKNYPHFYANNLPAKSSHSLIDLNGDGSQELLFDDNTTIGIINLYSGKNQSLAKNITDGMGNQVTFNYTRMNSGDGTYTKESSATFPLQDFTSSMYLVKQASTQNIPLNTPAQSTQYRYSGAQLHRQGKGYSYFLLL